jgi:ABC-type uncharacterized transport system permease subunit
MQRDIGVPASLITAVNGIIVVFAVSSQVFVRRRRQRRLQAESPVTAKLEVVEVAPRKVEA